MTQPLADSLKNASNERVLAYLADKSAHSDLSDVLTEATKPLGDVQIFGPDRAHYSYLAVSTRGVIFGFAAGMKAIAFRLSPTFTARALKTGAEARPDLGTQWVSFEVFRDDWPQVDLTFWARKAYVFAREPTAD